MTTQHDYDYEMYTVLAGLGWSDIPADYPARYGELKNRNDPAFVFCPIKTKYHPFGVPKKRFKLGVHHHDAQGADEIPSRNIDMDAPNWKRSLYSWHATATFKLAEIRAKYAERDAEKQRIEKRQKESWEALCAGSAAMRELAYPANHGDNGDVYDINVNWSHKYWSSKALNDMTVAEQADKVRRLCEFLVAEGWDK
jgi:hypothetical protein